MIWYLINLYLPFFMQTKLFVTFLFLVDFLKDF